MLGIMYRYRHCNTYTRKQVIAHNHGLTAGARLVCFKDICPFINMLTCWYQRKHIQTNNNAKTRTYTHAHEHAREHAHTHYTHTLTHTKK